MNNVHATSASKLAGIITLFSISDISNRRLLLHIFKSASLVLSARLAFRGVHDWYLVYPTASDL